MHVRARSRYALKGAWEARVQTPLIGSFLFQLFWFLSPVHMALGITLLPQEGEEICLAQKLQLQIIQLKHRAIKSLT